MKEHTERNNWLDVIKGLSCLGIIMVHFSCTKFGDQVVLLQRGLGRCGLSLFLMISGYLAAQKTEEKRPAWFVRQIKKILLYFVVFSAAIYLFYLLYDLLILRDGTRTIQVVWSLKNLFLLLIGGSTLWGGHLWYLPAYAGCLFVYWCASHVKWGYRAIAACTPVFLVLHLIFGRYSVIVLGRKFPHYWSRNFLFLALPVFTLGFLMAQMKPRIRLRSSMILLVAASACLLMFEVWSFREVHAYDGGHNNYVFSFVTSFLILDLVTNHRLPEVSADNFWACVGRKYSLFIYVFQYISAVLCGRVVAFLRPRPSGHLFIHIYQYGKPLFVFTLALLIALVCYRAEMFLAKRTGGRRKAARR